MHEYIYLFKHIKNDMLLFTKMRKLMWFIHIKKHLKLNIFLFNYGYCYNRVVFCKVTWAYLRKLKLIRLYIIESFQNTPYIDPFKIKIIGRFTI